MSCSCTKQSLIGKSIVTTLPYDDCVQCAEKHVSTAYMTFMNSGIETPNRQIIIGQLVCAGFHTAFNHQTISYKIRKVRQLVSYRKDFVEDLQILLIDIQQWLKNGNIQQEYDENIKVDKPIQFIPTETDFIKAQICFSSAMILSQQMGYQALNRSQIIGNLALCQHYIYRDNYDFAVKLSDVRHFVQNSSKKQIEYNWQSLCKEMDEIVLRSLKVE